MYSTVYLDGVLVWNLDGELLPIIAGGKGGGSSTTTVTVPPPTAQETELQGLNLEMAKKQAQQFTIASAMNDPSGALGYLTQDPSARSTTSQYAGLEKYDTPEFRTSLTDAQTSNKQNQQISDLANRRLLEQITGVAQLSPEESAHLDTMFNSAQSAGEANISRFGQENAQMRGLNMTDSPAAREFARATGEFNLGLQGAKAGAALDLGNASKMFTQNVSDFQNQLNQQSYQNRLGLSQSQGGIALSTMSNMTGQRMAQTTTNQQKQAAPQNWMGLAGSVVGAAGMAL